jgi:hypothetical protein
MSVSLMEMINEADRLAALFRTGFVPAVILKERLVGLGFYRVHVSPDRRISATLNEVRWQL